MNKFQIPNSRFQIKTEFGQAILALILIMTVALAIGVSLIQKSLVDVSTSNKVEDSQRAFSAAEAGIEKTLGGGSVNQNTSLDNQAVISNVTGGTSMPCVPGTAGCAQGSGSTQLALEYPAISKEEFAHIWLADPSASLPNCTGGTTNICYSQASLDIYWGSPTAADKAALQLKIIYFDGTNFQSKAYYFDPALASRSSPNGFTDVSGNCFSGGTVPMTTVLGTNRTFYCKQTVSSLPSGLMLIRMRLIYNTTSQPVAVGAVGNCGAPCSLPPQAKIITSTGSSGQSQRVVQLFQINNVVLPYFDFAIFSAGTINK